MMAQDMARGCVFLVALLATMQGSAAEPAPPLVLERTIELKDVSGRIDHMAVDLRRGRLFVAELGNGTVEAVDVAAGTVLRRLAGLREPQGVGYAPGADALAVASAGDGSVRLYRGEDLAPLAKLDLGDDADNIRLDPRTGALIVGYGGGALAVLDPATGSVLRKISLPAHPEGFQLDPLSGRAFVNLPDAGQIAVVDVAAGRQVGSWRVTGARSNFPMALDADGSTIAAVFRSPPRLVLMDTATGAATAQFDTCGDADDVFFDATRRRLYVSCGEGVVEVFQREDGGYRSLARVKTASGARTSLFVPELDRLFVAARAGLLGSDARILVFRPAS